MTARPPVDEVALEVEHFPRRYRFDMVRAYPVISGVSDPYAVGPDGIDAGFARCLASRNLERTHRLYLAAHPVPAPAVVPVAGIDLPGEEPRSG